MGEIALSASLITKPFFDNVVRFFGVPAEIITEVMTDRDPKFFASLR